MRVSAPISRATITATTTPKAYKATMVALSTHTTLPATHPSMPFSLSFRKERALSAAPPPGVLVVLVACSLSEDRRITQKVDLRRSLELLAGSEVRRRPIARTRANRHGHW